MTPPTIYETPRPAGRPGETVVTSTCGHNCGGRCVVNAHVVDDRIVRITTDPRRWSPELPPLHACVRGFGAAERVHHPDRLTHPLRRVGPRGAGQWARISWTRRSTPWRGSSGASATPTGRLRSSTPPDRAPPPVLHSRATVGRLLHLLGGCTELWSNLSAEAEVFAVLLHLRPGHHYMSAGSRARRLRELAASF